MGESVMKFKLKRVHHDRGVTCGRAICLDILTIRGPPWAARRRRSSPGPDRNDRDTVCPQGGIAMRSHGRTPLLAMAVVTTTVALTPLRPHPVLAHSGGCKTHGSDIHVMRVQR